MRKNIKNDKVIKAITIGLATMIAATSVPTNVYAGEGDESETTETSSEESHEEVTEETVVAVEAAAETLVPDAPAPAVEQVTVDAGIAVEATQPITLDQAIVSVQALQNVGDEGQPAEQLSTVTQSVTDLGYAKDLVTDIKEDLDDLKEVLADAGQTEKITPVAIAETSAPVLPTSEDEEGKSHVDREAAINNDGTYNFYDSSLDENGQMLQSFVGDYTVAVQLVKDGDIEAAEQKADEADKKLAADEAKIAFLQTAIKDSRAAEQAVAAAKSKLENVKAVRDQYNALMVQHFREIEDKEKKDIAKFNKDNGELDVAASAQALKDAGKVDTYANGRSETVLKLGRDLIVKLVKAEIESKGGTVLAFGDQYGNNKKQEATVGEVFINNAGEEQVSIQPKYDIYRSNGQDNGRTNSYHLSYKDKNGETHDDFYNIVYKSNKDKDANGNIDIENGIIYVARVYQKDGKWVTEDAQTEFDNFNLYANGSLINKALEDVTKAEAEAQELRDKIDELAQKSGIEVTDELEGMEAQLEELESAAQYSRNKLNALLEVIATAPRGGNTENEDSDAGDDTSDDAAGGETVIPGPGGFTYTIPGGFTLPATLLDGTTGTDATGASGVLGVRTGGGQEETGEGREDEGIAPRADFNTVNKVLGSTQNKKDSQLLKKIKNNEIPLAEIPNMDDEVKMNWMWLLIIFLLGATGKKMYDEYRKKKEAEENAKINR